MQHSSEQQTPLSECSGETTGEHLGKTTFSPLYALCCLGGTLPVVLNWLWQRFWSCRSQGWGSRDGSITLLCRDQLQYKSLEGSGWALLRPQVLQGIGKAVAVQSSLCQTVKKTKIKQQRHLCIPAFLRAITTELNWVPSVGSYFQTLTNYCKEQVPQGLAVFMLLLFFNKSCIYNV